MSNERTDGEEDGEVEDRPPMGGPPGSGGPTQIDEEGLPPDMEHVEEPPSTLSYLDDKDRMAAMDMGTSPASPPPPTPPGQGMTQDDIDAVADLPVESNRLPMWLILSGAAAIVAAIALFLVFVGGGGDDDNATTGGSTGAVGQVVAPTSPPAPTVPPAAPAAFRASAEQLRNANVIATDLAAIYGTCVYESTTNGATDVEQSVSSSPAMMQAMTAAGYQGVRSVSRAPTPCQGVPYNAASVSGNARDVAAAQALFAAARTNYQALFPGFTAFDVAKGQLDELYCQHGVFPSNNVIAVACWLRKGTSVTGVFILLPPNSTQAAIDEAKRDGTAFIQRIDGVLR